MSVSCLQCKKDYANKYSLAAHKSRYHPKPTSTTDVCSIPDPDADDQSQYEDATSNVDKLGDDSERSLETDDEVDNKSKDPTSIDDSNDGSDVSQGGKKSGKSLRKQFARRSQPYQPKRLIETDKKLDKILEEIKVIGNIPDKKLDKILEEIKVLGNKQSPINVNNAINHPQLIKAFCKAILDGSMPLQKTHLDALKPHREIVRKMAHGRSATRKRLIQAEVDRHKQCGDSVLKTVLDGVMTFLPTLFG